jgi:hypothetical protein
MMIISDIGCPTIRNPVSQELKDQETLNFMSAYDTAGDSAIYKK